MNMNRIMFETASSSIENVSRRGVLKGLMSTSGLVLAVKILPPRRALAEDQKWGADGMPHGTVNDPRAFVSIAPDGFVTIVCARSEMGQGVRTGIPLIVADEMEADWARVKIAQAPGDEAKFGNQDTDGSRSTRHFMLPMRQCGAAARMMLEAAAAKRWGVALAEVEANNHQVVHRPSGRNLGYGELAAEAGAMNPPAVDQLRAEEPGTVSLYRQGRDPYRRRFRHHHGPRQIWPGRAPARAEIRNHRPPAGFRRQGRILQFNRGDENRRRGEDRRDRAGAAPPGFLPSGGLAVVADNTWAAIQGRDALKIKWDDGAHGTSDSKAYRAELEATARQPGSVQRHEGDPAAAMAGAAKKVEAEYYIPHLAHATMEPPSATARIADGKVEVWTSVQSPQAAHHQWPSRSASRRKTSPSTSCCLAADSAESPSRDYAVEAALVSKALGGAPVKVVWTREDDIRNGFYHTVSVERLEAGTRPAGPCRRLAP